VATIGSSGQGTRPEFHSDWPMLGPKKVLLRPHWRREVNAILSVESGDGKDKLSPYRNRRFCLRAR
jgi:hypothetical protein